MSIISAVHLNITYANSFKSRNVLHPADATVAGPILKIVRATHGKPASRKLRNTHSLGLYKKAADCQIHATSLQECTRNNLRRSKHSKNFWWNMPLDWAYANFS